MSMPICVCAYVVFTCACPCVREIYCGGRKHTCLIVICVYLLRTFLTATRYPCPWHRDREGGRWEQQSSSDSCRGEWCEGTALFNPPVQTVTPVVFFLEHVFLSHYLPSLCPGAQAHWSPLHPHLCSAVQVSASGTEWPGTTVSKNQTDCLRANIFITTCAPMQECFCVVLCYCAYVCQRVHLLCLGFCPSVFCPSCCSWRMKMSPPSAEDSTRVPLRTTNYKLRAHHCPHVELETELCSQQGRG